MSKAPTRGISIKKQDALTELLRPHIPSDRRWCMSCKMHVVDAASHIVKVLAEAGVDIRLPETLRDKTVPIPTDRCFNTNPGHLMACDDAHFNKYHYLENVR